MSTQVQFRRGTNTAHATFTGADGEMTYNQTNGRLHSHDGANPNGKPHATLADVQTLAGLYAVASGTDTLTATVAPAPPTVGAFSTCVLKIANNNTGPVTLDLNGGGAVAVKKFDASYTKVDLAADDLVAGQIYVFIHDGTHWQVIGGLGGAGGGLVPIATFTAAGDASIDITGLDGTYQTYLIVGEEIFASTTAQLWARLSNDDGSTFEADAGDYGHLSTDHRADAATSVTDETSDTKIILGFGLYLGTSGRTGSLQLWVHNPAETDRCTTVDWVFTHLDEPSTNRIYRSRGAGVYGTAEATTALQLILSSGNISGTFTVYGVPTA